MSDRANKWKWQLPSDPPDVWRDGPPPRIGVAQGTAPMFLPPMDLLQKTIAEHRKNNCLPFWFGGSLSIIGGIPEHEQWKPIVEYIEPEVGKFHGWRRINDGTILR